MQPGSVPTSMPSRPSVGIGVLVTRKHKVLLGRRRGSHGSGMWAPPGGNIEYGETLEEAAIREVLEETGLVVSDVSLVGVTSDVFVEQQRHYVTVFYHVESSSGLPELREPEKSEGWEWFDWRHLPDPLFLPFQSLLAQEANAFIATVLNP